MATISNTPRPGYVYDSADAVWYPIGTGTHSHSEIASTIVDAKGDIITATAADTPARLAVGNNGDTLVADSAAATGLAYIPTFFAGKNAVINGGFDIWQRGTSAATAGGSYVSADRWWVYTASGSATFGQETTTIPANSQYAAKITSTGAGTSIFVAQAIETANVLAYAGKNLTFSGQVAASASVPLTIQVQYSTTVDNAVNGSWTTITPTSGGTVTPTSTTYVPFTAVFAIPSTAKSLRIGIYHTGTVANSVVTYLGNFQAEVGSTATTFSRAGGTIQGELAACQRYFQRAINGVNSNERLTTGQCISTSATEITYRFPVVMRTSPTFAISSASHFITITNTGGSAGSPGAIGAGILTPNMARVDTSSGTNMVGGNATSLQSISASATMDFSAEL